MVQVFADRIHGIDRAPLEATIAPVLRAHGVETAEVSYQMERGGWVLRVTVESLEDSRSAAEHDGLVSGRSSPADGGPEPASDERIHLGLLTEISRDLSSALDVADVIPHHYNLEVSSPGLERPLRSMRDFVSAVGKLAKVHLARPTPDGQHVLRGKVLSAADGAIALEVDGKERTARLDDVERAHLIFELAANPKGGRKPAKHQKH